LVTGANGTVGRYVVALAEAAGYRVVANDRIARGLRVPVRGEVRPADITEPGVADELVRGVDYVIHTAAMLDPDASDEALMRVNAGATLALYRAAARASAKRMVHVSTATLYDGAGQDRSLAEDTPLAPRGPYGESKLAAERGLLSREQSLPVTLMRPAPIYGRRGRHFAASLLAVGPIMRLFSPRLPALTAGPLATMAHAEDVARALLFVLERDEAADAVFNISDADPWRLGERLTETFRAYGLKTFGKLMLPERPVQAAANLLLLPGPYQVADRLALLSWGRVVRRHGIKSALRPRMDREAMSLLHQPLQVDASALRELGFEPRHVRWSESFQDVLRWYQAEGWVPRYG